MLKTWSLIAFFFIPFALADAQAASVEADPCLGLPLELGDSKKFIRPLTWTGLSSNYTLKKITEKKYQALLNLNFVEDGNNQTMNTQRMRDQVLGCVEMANTKLLGPDGDRLEIKIIDPAMAKNLPKKISPPQVDINVLPPGLPSNMLNFSTMDCSNIVHELFHTMGLVDEYDDSLRSKGGVQAYCRVIPTANTLMGKPVPFFEDVFGKTVECECTGTCQKFWESSPPERRKFLEGQNQPCFQLQSLSLQSSMGITLDPPVSSLKGNILTIVRQPKPGIKSLLTPNQFNKLISGYCPKTSEGYQECASYAYFQKELSPGQMNPQCENIPAACADDKYFLGLPW